ncbi:ABC transporter permease [uncultured Cellulomonas sp.]|uniref:ABC transporter permease n=1 Tax=uncultured Cellulomonas sp. TaxID=189682 RepID=UPI00261EFA6E|nr:ABC transporter permease [uncultured Cellulomonas sp.]
MTTDGARAFGAAVEVETLKLRRATAARVAGVAVVVGCCGLSGAFLAVARAGGDSTMAAKVAPLVHGTGWAAYLGVVAQILSVAVLLAVGLVTSWSFGREFVDGTWGSLVAIPTPPGTTAAAKLVVLAVWGLGLCLATVALAVPVGLVVGLGPPDGAALGGAARVVVVGALTVLLGLPFAWVSSAQRGYLPGIAALLAVVVVTQLVTVAGAGGWFPYAAPGLWAGMGGQTAADAVTGLQLALAVPVAVLGGVATVRWWQRAEVR